MSTSKQDLFNDELIELLEKWYPSIYKVEFNDYKQDFLAGGFYIDIDIDPENYSSDANHFFTLPPFPSIRGN